ncbi:MAG: hypothetical protein J6W27_01505 [Alphaproteobacteria bacterium]|nr:hypothetical protein [Alphaproteobacteria bacterium]
MAISTAVQRGSWIYVYDENGSQTTTLSGELHGFTGSTVSVRRDGWVYVYDEHGHQQNVYSAR